MLPDSDVVADGPPRRAARGLTTETTIDLTERMYFPVRTRPGSWGGDRLLMEQPYENTGSAVIDTGADDAASVFTQLDGDGDVCWMADGVMAVAGSDEGYWDYVLRFRGQCNSSTRPAWSWPTSAWTCSPVLLRASTGDGSRSPAT